MRHTILCVDDEPDNVDALERLFRRDYKVLKAHSGPEALALLAENEVSLIISDQRMPEMTGVDFLAESIASHPDTIRFLLTGYTDIDSVIEAVNSGQIYRYLTKPWDPVDLTNTVNKAIERYELGHELQRKNEELAKALDELKTLDAAKNQFMVLINHELKTPLTVITSFLELLKETPLNDEQNKYSDRMQASCDRLHELVNDVLELVSAEAGVTNVAKQTVDLNTIFSKIESQFEQDLKSKKQTVKTQSANLKGSADEKILTKVLNRLMDNAIKFGDDGSTIPIKADAIENEIEISIQNTGTPISEEMIGKILKPFTLDEDIMNHSQGLGLGLSLTQALLKAMGTSLDIQCEGQTVTASFRIPASS